MLWMGLGPLLAMLVSKLEVRLLVAVFCFGVERTGHPGHGRSSSASIHLCLSSFPTYLSVSTTDAYAPKKQNKN